MSLLRRSAPLRGNARATFAQQTRGKGHSGSLVLYVPLTCCYNTHTHTYPLPVALAFRLGEPLYFIVQFNRVAFQIITGNNSLLLRQCHIRASFTVTGKCMEIICFHFKTIISVLTCYCEISHPSSPQLVCGGFSPFVNLRTEWVKV